MKKGSYGSLESVSTNKYILRLMSDMKKLYMCNLEKVILFNIMKRTTTLLSALILALSLRGQSYYKSLEKTNKKGQMSS